MALEPLEPLTRRYMCEEIALDEERGVLYQDPRLRPGVLGIYLELLKQAAAFGTPESLAEAIRMRELLAHTELRTRNGRARQARVPRVAAEVLASMELGRYHVRAMCRRAIDEGRELEVYRARRAIKPRAQSEMRIGQRIDPAALLADLRENSDKLGSSLGVPAGPNSGLSVRFVEK